MYLTPSLATVREQSFESICNRHLSHNYVYARLFIIKNSIEMFIIWNYCIIAREMIKKMCIKSRKCHKHLVFEIKYHIAIMHVYLLFT